MESKFKTIIESEKPVLIDFFTGRCEPCNRLGFILEQVKSEMKDLIKIVKIDVDKNQVLATNYQVSGVPTLMLFRNGTQVWRQSGVLQKHALIDVIKSH